VQRLGLLASIAFSAGALLLVPAAHGRPLASLSLNISFFANGTISVTTPDGTPLGVTSGAPQIIPAGFYTLLFSGPGGCTSLPYFHLTGPGANIVTNMAEGATQKTTNTVDLLPSSTYVWTDDAFPGVLHSFTTSAVVEGAPPSGAPSSSGSAGNGKGVSYPDIVGSEIVPFRGTLTAAVTAAGRLSLAFEGKSVTRLESGRYTIAVTDRSSSRGFTLQKAKHAMVAITGSAFTGNHSATVHLTAGRWVFGSGAGASTYSVLVG
jgi:hypothetical protein